MCSPFYTIATAIHITHSYYSVRAIPSATSPHEQALAWELHICCLFVASKIEETVRKLKDIIIAAVYISHSKELNWQVSQPVVFIQKDMHLLIQLSILYPK